MTPDLRIADGLPETFAGRYRIEARIGAGASSTVYRATDTVAGHAVALKVLDPRLSWDGEALARLRREVLISRRVTHPGVVRVHDMVSDGRFAALVQELVSGEPLVALIAREAPLAVPRAVALIRGVLETLAACHQKGVLHRDLKPSNVLVEPDGRSRLIDFGIARVSLMTTVTHTGAILGTPGYQAPELLRGERPDLRADLYGAGLLLYELLTGAPAFAGQGAGAPLRQLHGPPPDPRSVRPDLPPRLAALIGALLDPEPEHRPADAWEVGAALDDLASGSPEPGLAGGACRGCSQPSRSAIPFCPRCGLYKRIPVSAGEWFVRLRGVDRAGDYQRHLVRLFGPAVRESRSSRLRAGQTASAILVRGVSRETADALATDARNFGGSPEVGRGYGYLQLREVVADGVLALGLVGSLAAVWATGQAALTTWLGGWLAGHVGWFRVAVAMLIAGLALALIARASRPLLRFSRLDTRKPPPPADEASAALAARVAAGRDGPLARELAGALDAFWVCREILASAAGGGAAAGPLAGALDRALERLFVIAAAAGDLASLLETRGIAEAARDLERIQARRRAAGGAPGDLARLETVAREELAAREEADALLAVSASRIVLGQGVFQRTTRALSRATAPAAAQPDLDEFLAHADVDLAALEQSLTAVRPSIPSAQVPGGAHGVQAEA